MSALAPDAALALAIRLLEERSFSVRARNERGDSVYLTPEGSDHAIRVSNHARTPKQRRKHPEVATSVVIRDPKTSAQVEAMVEAALRAFAAKSARQAAAEP